MSREKNGEEKRLNISDLSNGELRDLSEALKKREASEFLFKLLGGEQNAEPKEQSELRRLGEDTK